MTEEIRFNTALATAIEVARSERLPLSPERLSRLTYLVLDAIYQAERRLGLNVRVGDQPGV